MHLRGANYIVCKSTQLFKVSGQPFCKHFEIEGFHFNHIAFLSIRFKFGQLDGVCA